jgi:hypothetical protein
LDENRILNFFLFDEVVIFIILLLFFKPCLCSLFLFSLQRKKKFNAFNEKFVLMNENFFIEEEIMKTREYKKVETRMQE